MSGETENRLQRRPAGEVRLRWFGDRPSRVFRRRRVSSALAAAAERWFASNQSPDAFVMLVVIERDGARMSDEEADAYVRDQLDLKRATRGIT